MKIKFKSISIQNGQENTVEFVAECENEQSKFKDVFDKEAIEYNVYRFKDPQNHQPVRIEINPTHVNILNVNACLELRHKKMHSGSYINVEKNKFQIKTFTDTIKIIDNYCVIEYELFNFEGHSLGAFKIKIEQL